MTMAERLAQIATLQETATQALEEAKRLSDEAGLDFVFVFPKPEENWEDSESSWSDSGCSF